ncbi:acetyltransferase (GNAT) family protein [Roseibium hamelinense]|uniref:Acetyltransferase (GNAT) family protein n=1 Tax=Roseibium hamelinense TaxID=150831 RepID=A0A562SMD1_9HYPH|nr:GNAT family N-acetyltransferase [Roseibium hamelinense]TWI81816.1 acetyltransferase (GNAT) family protein [Roseibium hamelinense]
MLFPSHLTSGLTPLIIDPKDPGEHYAPWQELSKAAIDPNPFFGPEFLIPFLENMETPKVHLCVLKEAETGRWMMAAPVVRRRPGLAIPVTSLYATEYGPLGVPLMQSDAGPQTTDAFLQLAAEQGGMPVVAMPYMPVEGTSARILSQSDHWHLATSTPAERAAHDAGLLGEAQFASAFSGKRRKELPRLMRRLAEQGEVKLASVSGPQAVEQFEAFLELEEKGWKGKSGTALKSRPQTLTFARAMIATRATRDGVRIDTLQVGGEAIALLVILREGTKAFSWKIAYNEDFGKYSPGAQLALYALERNLNDPDLTDGADSLAVPGHTMIEPLWNGRIRTATMLFARSLPGRLLQAGAKADIVTEQRLRRYARKYLKRGKNT